MTRLGKMTTLYRNLKTGQYFVQPYTIGPVAATEFGAPTVLQPTEFEGQGGRGCPGKSREIRKGAVQQS